jgi:hypothetical protein
MREGDHLEDQGGDGRIISIWMFRKWVGDMDWTDLAERSDMWRALLKAVMNFRVP